MVQVRVAGIALDEAGQHVLGQRAFPHRLHVGLDLPFRAGAGQRARNVRVGDHETHSRFGQRHVELIELGVERLELQAPGQAEPARRSAAVSRR